MAPVARLPANPSEARHQRPPPDVRRPSRITVHRFGSGSFGNTGHGQSPSEPASGREKACLNKVYLQWGADLGPLGRACRRAPGVCLLVRDPCNSANER